MSTCVHKPSSSAHRFWGANWRTSSQLVLTPKPRNHHGDFVDQITKPQLPVLWPKPGNPSKWFWGETTRTVTTGFEIKPRETVDLGFEAELRNPRSSSSCAWCRPYTVSPDLSIVQQLSTWPVLYHHRSFAPSLLPVSESSSLPTMPHLSPTHHGTSKHVSPHETDSRLEPPKFSGFKLKPRQSIIHHKSKQGPLGFSL
jgi:hypothetical protein